MNLTLKNQGSEKGIAPETELLISCVRTDIDPLTAEKINRLLQKDINWTYLVDRANDHRVMPLLYWTLKHTNIRAIPEVVLNQLKIYFNANALRNILLTQELYKILNIFQKNDIPAIPFKGPVLAASVYNNLALRQFSDLDIIIKKDFCLKAQNLLLSEGYVLQRKEHHLTETNQNNYLHSQHRYDEWYWKTLDINTLFGARVEIHWETTRKHIIFPLNPEKLWDNLESISISGMTFPSLPPEDLLPILCVNYSKDHWTQLKMICDIAELIRSHPKMNWEKVIEHANSLGRERTLLVGLFLAHDLFGTALPKKIWQKMQTDPGANSLSKQVRERLFPNCGYDPGWIEKMLFNVRLRENLQDKVRYILFSTVKIFECINLEFIS